MSSSWKLDSSQTIQASGGASTPESARPTLPATVTAPPRNIAPSHSVVVVFPFVPVTPTIGFGRKAAASSTSLQIGIGRARRRARCPAARRGSSRARPRRRGATGRASLPRSRSARTTSTPCRSSSAAAACPERLLPRTTARFTAEHAAISASEPSPSTRSTDASGIGITIAVPDQPGDARVGVALLELLEPVGGGVDHDHQLVVGELRERVADEIAVENEDRHPPRKNRK